MNFKVIIFSLVAFLTSLFFCSVDVQAQVQGLQIAGSTQVGTLYVDTNKTSAVKKDGAHYLTVFAEEKYTNQVFLSDLHKNEKLKEVVGAIYLFLFDNRGSSYCVAAKYLVDARGKVCLDCGNNMKMKSLTANDKTMLNAYTLCLKSLENKKRIQSSFIKKK